jgi:hypothetical protein
MTRKLVVSGLAMEGIASKLKNRSSCYKLNISGYITLNMSLEEKQRMNISKIAEVFDAGEYKGFVCCCFQYMAMEEEQHKEEKQQMLTHKVAPDV